MTNRVTTCQKTKEETMKIKSHYGSNLRFKRIVLLDKKLVLKCPHCGNDSFEEVKGRRCASSGNVNEFHKVEYNSGFVKGKVKYYWQELTFKCLECKEYLDFEIKWWDANKG